MTDAELIQKAAANASIILGLDQSKASDHLIVVRIYLALNQICGGDIELMKQWATTYNKHLGYCPAAGIEGNNADDVLSYLESSIFV